MGIHRERTWFNNLAFLKPAPYKPWRHALRLSIGTGLPLLVGVLSSHTGVMLYVSLGAFLTAVTIRLDPYHERFRQIAISSFIGALGCLIGPVVAGHGPGTLMMLMFVGLASGLLSGYGAAFSAGAMNLLVLAVVNAHAPTAVPIWLIFLSFLAGSVLVSLLLSIEAAIDRDRPERHILASLINALAILTRSIAAQNSLASKKRRSIEIERRMVIDATTAAYASLIGKGAHGRARTRYTLKTAATLSLINQLTISIIADRVDTEALIRTADHLDAIAYAHLNNAPYSPENYALNQEQRTRSQFAEHLIERIAGTIWSSPEPHDENQRPHNRRNLPFFFRNTFSNLARKLIIGPNVVFSALQLSLCMGIAVIAGQIISGDHSYWLPMTVAIVLKPDYGSVFVRAIHRSVGTVVGVIIAMVMMYFIHNEVGLVLTITLLCAFLPWAGLRSYAAMVAILTPVILLMIDLVAPGPVLDYGLQRLIDTLCGAAIALIFGYLIWPRSQEGKLNTAFAHALEGVGGYLRAVTAPTLKEPHEHQHMHQSVLDGELAAYRLLSDLRTQLQRLIAEPPPAGREAAAWFPAVAGAERLCDAITAYAEGQRLGDPPTDKIRVTRAEDAIALLSLYKNSTSKTFNTITSREKDDLFGEIEAEIAWLTNFVEQGLQKWVPTLRQDLSKITA